MGNETPKIMLFNIKNRLGYNITAFSTLLYIHVRKCVRTICKQ